MPNWVRNVIEFSGDENKIAALKKFVKSKDSEFDFNNIIPMPKELNIESGGRETIAIACAEARKKGFTYCSQLKAYSADEKMSFDEWANLGDKYLKNKEQWGFTTWYDWHCHYWGTKWNSCDVIWNNNIVKFDTAWSTPEPLLDRLADLFPDVQMSLKYADEDIGYNCGEIKYNINSDQIPRLIFGTEEAQQFACSLWNIDYDEYINEIEESENETEIEPSDLLELLK